LHDTNNSMGLYYSVEDELRCKNCPAGEAEQLMPLNELIFFTRQQQLSYISYTKKRLHLEAF